MRMDVNVTNNQYIDPEDPQFPSSITIRVLLSKEEMGTGASIIGDHTFYFFDFVEDNPEHATNNQSHTFVINEGNLTDGSVHIRYEIFAPEGQEQYTFLGYTQHVGRVFVKPINEFPNDGLINNDIKLYIGDDGTLKQYAPNEFFQPTPLQNFYRDVKEWPIWLVNGWPLSGHDYLGAPYMDMITEFDRYNYFKTTLLEAVKIPFEPHAELANIAELDDQGNIRIRIVYNLGLSTEFIDTENPELGLKHQISPTTKVYFKRSAQHFVKIQGVHYAKLDLVVERDPDPGTDDPLSLGQSSWNVLWFPLALRAEVEVLNPQKNEWSVYNPRINTEPFYIAVNTLVRTDKIIEQDDDYIHTVGTYITHRDS